MAINDIEELTITGAYLGQVVVNTYHFRSQLPAPTAGLTDEQMLIDAWQTACQTQYLAIFHTGVTFGTISARQVCGSLPLRARIDENLSTTGGRGVATAPTAPWFAALVRERTRFAGKSYQGRNFYVVDSEADFAGVNLDTALVTAINTYNTALMTAFGPIGTNSDWRLFAFSKKLASVPGTQCQDAGADVVSLSTSPYLTTMRSRRSKSGA